MKKLFGILSMFFLCFLISPVVSQTTTPDQSVKISETERIVDKYLDKAGTAIDSTFSKIVPMAEKAFNAYVHGYHVKGTFDFWFPLIGFMLFLLASFFFCYIESKRNRPWDEPSFSSISAIVSLIGVLVFFITILTNAGDAITMMNAPEYHVIKDILGSIR